MNAVRIAGYTLASVALLGACAEEVEVPTYQALPVTVRDISVSVQAAGAVLPDTVVEVKSKASGEILSFNVETGDIVQRGTIMARIDRRVPQNRFDQAQAQLDIAEARLRNAETQAKRSEELFEAKAITEQEYESSSLDVANSRASVISAQIEVENAKIALDDTEVRAPITGTVIAKNVERGAVISSPTSDVGGGTVLMRMADMSLVQVKTYVDETDIGKLKKGLATTVSVEAFPNRPFTGEVLKIEPQADTISNVTMFPVLVRIPNTDGLLRPGMNAEVNISVGSASGVLAVPNSALRTEEDVNSAAMVLGLSQDELIAMLEASSNPNPSAGDSEPAEVSLPEAAPSREEIMAVFTKQREGKTLTADEQKIMETARAQMGGGNRGGRGGGNKANDDSVLFGGKYIVFTMRNGQATAVYVETGITDLDYSEVRSGLTAQDSVLLLPSASLIAAQDQLQEWMQRRSGGLPGQGS